MVSLRWETRDEPDPDCIQFHGVIRFIIQACMMAMGSAPNVFNGVDFSEIILCPNLMIRLNALYQEYAHKVLSGYDVLNKHRFHRCQKLVYYLLQTIGEQNTILVGADIAPLAYMMEHFVVWYDFTSLPQAPRTPEEQEYFDQELRRLDDYFSKNYTIILWSRSSLKRAWCFLEAIISFGSWKHSIFSSENSLISSTKPAPINELFYTISSIKFGNETIDLSDHSNKFAKIMQKKEAYESEILRLFNRKKEKVDLTTDLTSVLGETLLNAKCDLEGKSESEVLSYLMEHKFKCTNGSDIKLIAKKLSTYYETKRR
jgi:hypothetical protein